MPKQTFLSLPEDKQNTLIQSAKKEFSRVPLHEASIANIIKDAGIPRGSFYQYFEDKEDLYYYLLNQVAQENNKKLNSILQEKKGNLMDALADQFRYMISLRHDEEHKDFLRYAFLNMNHRKENTMANNIYKESLKNERSQTLEMVDTSYLNIEDKQELSHVIRIVGAITFHNLVQVFVHDLTDEEAIFNYDAQISLIKKGLQRKEVD
ncbi:TetR/AcrR family transcriptional regulator [Terribacillus saccharophilus]|uniref:TetR family transcriptional regulator n=1 Tax=Terribacillus saccharophilus TaxID=361277 RepID=A0A268ABD1_9BACI|nr:TetR family transcriptional regulator [Terribacillus saccharophilus]PAD21440.1 TetR family transcriptional regulator [Terribacillus saccharophilus]PAF16886.1 TetR family transcriptional regulator [Terribacillus saccharophilus]PAF20965.1 TetR family transcriptional regulator [Terribacillus saccharophilus]PAF36336.1 TetR family transcriptional regulator [Terribacillus saccharophilus]PAF39559.1 TetR family transcriptional regulator [Terribacillus saccharophilus]